MMDMSCLSLFFIATSYFVLTVGELARIVCSLFAHAFVNVPPVVVLVFSLSFFCKIICIIVIIVHEEIIENFVFGCS